jgi:probable HAF family extracellular repeat protein
MSRTRGRCLGPVVLLTYAGLVASIIALVMTYPLTRPAAAAPTAQKPVYTVTPLGTLGGSQSIARDINNAGQVVGQSQNASGQNRGFLWQDDGQGMKPIGTLGGPTSPARGINKDGQVVGFSRISSSSSNTQLRAYLAQNGLPTNLGTLTDLSNSGSLITFSNSEAWHINDSGVAVGRSFNNPTVQGGPTTEGRAVLWENGEIKNVGAYLKTPYSEAWAINDHGQVVGEAGGADQQAKAFLYDNNTNQVTDIDAAGRQDPDHPVFPYQYSEAMGINDHGQVVGWSYRTTDPDPEGEAFLYEKGTDGVATMVPLDPLVRDPYDSTDDDLYSRARDIDESGRIVGWSRGTTGNGREQFSATIWEDQKATDLNDLIPAKSRWRLTEDGTIKGWKLVDAYAINESGQIVGSGFKDGNDAPNQIQAFLLTPDTTAPKIECGTADDLWHSEDVSIPCAVSDDGVGLADPTADAGFTLTTSVPAGTETADAPTDSREVCDAAGNCATAGPVGGNKVDKKAPVISITTAPSGDEYELGDDVTVSYDCLDGGSGTAACSGPVASGGKLDTASVGQHTFTVETKDEVGNVGSDSIVYQVIYDFTGFFRPVDNPDVLNKAKAGSALPVKFSLGGDMGLDVFSSGSPSSRAIGCDSSDPVDAIEETVTAGSSSLSYDATTDLYTYVWKTNKAWAGTCRQLAVTLDDGSTHLANFKFVK